MKFSRNFLDFLGIIITDDSKSIVRRVKPWTRDIRCHYSTQHIPSRIFDLLVEQADGLDQVLSQSKCMQSSSQIAIHYRLGDLVELGSKKPVDWDRISSVVRNIMTENSSQIEVSISSDSPELALSILKDSFPEMNFQVLAANAWNTILQFVNSTVFVGTNSKLSLWIAMIMVQKSPNPVNIYLPVEVRHHIEANLGNLTSHQKIIFY